MLQIVSPLPMMIPLKTCDHILEYDIKFHNEKKIISKKGYSQQNSRTTLSQSTRSERLSSKSVADLKPESIHIHFISIYRIYVNIFNTWYIYNIMHAMYCLMFLARWVYQINALSHPTLRYSIKTTWVWKRWEFSSQQSLIRDFGWEWDSLDFAHLVHYRVGQSVESALIALAAFFSALSAFFNFRQKLPYFDVSRQKRVFFNCFATKQCLSMLKCSLWLPLWLSLALTATLWHTLALPGSLLLSNFAYTALDRLTGPLLCSHRRCHDDALYPALVHYHNHIEGDDNGDSPVANHLHLCIVYPWWPWGKVFWEVSK